MSIWKSIFPRGSRDPICKKCGHTPCEGCIDWCDHIIDNVYCPKCEGVAKVYAKEKIGSYITCVKCNHEFKLSETDIEDCEICCDGECEWDMSEEEVYNWCMKNR